MANGDPIRAKYIFENADEVWFTRALVLKAEKAKTGRPDYVVGLIG